MKVANAILARVVFILMLLYSLTHGMRGNAQETQPDQVWLEPPRPTATQSTWYPQAIETVSGEIAEFDAKRMVLQNRQTKQQRVVAAARVLWVEVGAKDKQQSLAIEQFMKGGFNESLRSLLETLKQRPPIWQQQWLSMMAAQAAWRSGRAAIAIKLVEQLDRRPLPPLVLAWLPVAWSSSRVESETRKVADDQLDNPSPAVRLIAASWLLSSDRRDAAAQTLAGLSRDNARPEIAKLAEVLRWRTTAPPDIARQATRWQEKLDALPLVMQVGPTITLMERFEAGGLTAEATRLRLSLQKTPPHPHPDLINFPPR
ncbi:hypothetical protein Poly41_09960 [Novipirellula artificiosorum]|uniref:Uncharacterized protein n=2 Tax=Novipirellula artificiosorum TaxID=2528016 RepID=A0A5C6E5I6_9BACT|nr:hypothetical protein Poly41_09960 [Novipirellula artificiosorum]